MNRPIAIYTCIIFSMICLYLRKNEIKGSENYFLFVKAGSYRAHYAGKI